MKIAFVTRVYVRLVHCGELVKCVIWEEHISESTFHSPCTMPLESGTQPKCFWGLYGGTGLWAACCQRLV